MAVHLQFISLNMQNIWLVYCLGVPIQFGIILSFLLEKRKNKKETENLAENEKE